MEFEGIIVKDNPGLCRCCLSEGCYKDLSTEYIWMGESEVYADMLMECFDISISQHNDGPNGSSRLICEVCITRLRDACNFKKQVLESEKKFIDMLSRGELRSNVITYEQPMKEEIQVETVLTTDDEGLVEYLEDDVDYLGNNDDETNKERQKGETITTIVLQEDSPSRLKQTASRTEKKKTVKKAVIKEGKIVKEKIGCAAEKKQRKRELKQHIAKIFKYSTVAPFKWSYNRYNCFYCADTFTGVRTLHEHTRKIHEKPNYVVHLTKYANVSTPIKIDVAILFCRKCKSTFCSFISLLEHLEGIVESCYADCFLLFELCDDKLSCHECEEEFSFFGTLYSHVNKNHRVDAERLCNACGKRFFSSYSLCQHVTFYHKATFKCKFRSLILESEPKKISHEFREHGELIYKFCKCDQRFGTKYLRNVRILRHDARKGVTRETCSKLFVNGSCLRRHVKSMHLKEKNFKCPECDSGFFDNYSLKQHSLVHVDFQMPALFADFRQKE